VIVLDSSPLIYLGKSNALFIIRELYGKALIPPLVYKEVVEVGGKKGFEDAEAVKNEIGELLIVQHPHEETIIDIEDDAEKKDFHLGKGEIEGIALCIDTNSIFISDDDDAKRYAETRTIASKGTIYLLLRAYKDKIISKDVCARTFEEIVEKGFWISPEIINMFHKRLGGI